MFAFDMYDRDNSGIIDDKEVLGMLKDVYGPGHQANVQAAQIRVAVSARAALPPMYHPPTATHTAHRLPPTTLLTYLPHAAGRDDQAA